MAGKTGTAQWTTDRELAWFAGFFPVENPRFAFAVLYAGAPGEEVSGSRKAAPMVPAMFEALEDEIKPMIQPPVKAMIIVEEGGEVEGVEASGDGVLNALPAKPLTPGAEVKVPDFDGPIPAAMIVEEDEEDREDSAAQPEEKPEEKPEDEVPPAPPAAVVVPE
jgi:membrane carboxypeptidase/penicillin-binding protein